MQCNSIEQERGGGGPPRARVCARHAISSRLGVRPLRHPLQPCHQAPSPYPHPPGRNALTLKRVDAVPTKPSESVSVSVTMHVRVVPFVPTALIMLPAPPVVQPTSAPLAVLV